MSKSVIGAAIGFLLGLLGNLLAAWIQKEMLQDSFTPVTIVVIVLLTVIGIVVGASLDGRSKKPAEADIHSPKGICRIASTLTNRRGIYWIITGLVTATIAVAGLAVVLSGGFRARPSTVYFVVDTTEKMQPIFDDVREQVQVAAGAVRQDSRIGLRVYGGDTSSTSICQDSRRLLEISEYPEAQRLLDLVLAGVEPHGHSSMTGAILETFLSDVNEENRQVKLILITSGIDPLCDPPAGDYLKDRAKDIGQGIELLIISIGEQNASSRRIFESYAQAFRGNYLAISDAQELPPIISSVSLYGYGYGYPFYGQSAPSDQ